MILQKTSGSDWNLTEVVFLALLIQKILYFGNFLCKNIKSLLNFFPPEILVHQELIHLIGQKLYLCNRHQEHLESLRFDLLIVLEDSLDSLLQVVVDGEELGPKQIERWLINLLFLFVVPSYRIEHSAYRICYEVYLIYQPEHVLQNSLALYSSISLLFCPQIHFAHRWQLGQIAYVGFVERQKPGIPFPLQLYITTYPQIRKFIQDVPLVVHQTHSAVHQSQQFDQFVRGIKLDNFPQKCSHKLIRRL